MFPKRSGIVVAVLLAAGCGGEDAPDKPKPVTYEQLGNQVGQLADELRWGCSNLPPTKRAAARVERSMGRLAGGGSDAEAKRLSRQAVAEAQEAARNCP